MTGTLRRAELPQRLGLNLTDTLAGDVELLADFFERVLALAADAEAEPDHLLLLRRKRLQDVRGFVAYVRVDNRIDRRTYPAILDQIAESRLTITTHGSFERHWIARDGLELLDLLHRDIHPAADLLVRRGTTHFLLELTSGPEELVHAFVHVHRNTDGAGL